MPKLKVKTIRIDEDRHVCFSSESDIETDFEEDEVGRLFRAMRREYGRCTGKVYVTSERTGQSYPVGWSFEKRVPYDDGAGFRPHQHGRPLDYLQSAWIILLNEVQKRHV